MSSLGRSAVMKALTVQDTSSGSWVSDRAVCTTLIKTKWLKLKYFCPFEKKGGPGTDHLEGKDRWENGRGRLRRQWGRDIQDVFNIFLREVGILAETVTAVRSRMHNLW